MQAPIRTLPVSYYRTEEYRSRLGEARDTLDIIRAKLAKRRFRSSLSELELARDARVFIVFLKSDRPYWQKIRSVVEAVELAYKFGSTGWWSLEQLAQFADSGTAEASRLFESAMYDLGYRRSRARGRSWARVQPKEPPSGSFSYHPTPTRHITCTEAEFEQSYSHLLIGTPSKVQLGQSFGIEATPTGMLFARMDVNPFSGHRAESLWELGLQLAKQGHFATEQPRYSLRGENIYLGDNPDYVKVKARREDGREIVQVWPSTVRDDNALFSLLSSLHQLAAG